jgi:diguanylate cyclase (GGDEF)-like protein
MSTLGQLIPIKAGALFLWDESRTRFTCRYAVGEGRAALTAAEADTLEQLASHLEHGSEKESGSAIGSVLLTQLSIGNRLVGALAVTGSQGTLQDDHQRLLDHVSRQAAIVVQNSIVFEQTRQMSFTDQLTDLPNRRYFLQHIEHEFARSDRLGCPIALLVVDVNRFKQINDTYGHEAGDRVLTDIGRVMRALLRPYDVCARYGGDEFVVALWDCDAKRAAGRRAELEEAIATCAVPLSDGRVVTPSASVGVSVFPQDGRHLTKLMTAADQDMYARKAQRRADVQSDVAAPVA